MSSKSLGKGINAIINPKAKKATSAPGVSKISLKYIKPNPDQPRRDFNEKLLEDLCDSIKEKGVITPITVRERDGSYEIIAGERRWRAAKKAKLRSVPAYVININNASEMMEVALIENIQRESLNPIEEAEGYAILNSQHDLSHDDIAKTIYRLYKKKKTGIYNIGSGHPTNILKFANYLSNKNNKVFYYKKNKPTYLISNNNKLKKIGINIKRLSYKKIANAK